MNIPDALYGVVGLKTLEYECDHSNCSWPLDLVNFP